VRYREVRKALSKGGCEILRQKGSHVIWYSPVTDKVFPVPNHPSKDLPKPLLKAIQEQSGIKL